jgi:hypothetical protein
MNNDHLQRKTRVTDVGQIYVCVCKTSDIFLFVWDMPYIQLVVSTGVNITVPSLKLGTGQQ